MSGDYIRVYPARLDDADLLDGDARTVDRAEWAIASGMKLAPALRLCIARADGLARIMVAGSRPLCIWGAGPSAVRGQGIAWLLGTNLGQRMALRVQRHFREGVEELHDTYPTLTAEAWDQNHLHHFWMERLGFQRTGQTRTMGLGGTFIQFKREDTRVHRPD